MPGFTEAKEPRFRSQATSFYTELLNNSYLLQKNEPANEPANEPVNEPANEPVKKTLLQKDLMDEMSLNPSVTRLELVERLNVSLISVKRAIAKLKDMNFIERIGADKSGHLVVIEHNTKELK